MNVDRPKYQELVIRTDDDHEDLLSVLDIVFYDDDGEEQVCAEATNACFSLNTCKDQGSDAWGGLMLQVVSNLRNKGITYGSIYFEDDRGQSGYPTGAEPPRST